MPAAEQPSGEVTLVFSDIEGSTKLLHELGTDAYREALAEHRRIVREAYGRYAGYEVDYEGDAFFYVFASASDAVAAVSEVMAGLEDGPIRIRVGMHTGTPALDPPKYVGMDVHFAARVMSSAHGGQVVLSKATADLVELELRDLGEHRLKDIPQAVPIFQLGTGSFPPLKTISNTNLPRPASSFVGRDDELLEVLSRFEAGARLVTLSGPGGTGKTRLAIEAAATLVPEFKAGVFWVGLATLRDPALVTETIAQTLGAKDGLAQHIGDRELLLLLDNLEQVIECAPELSELLTACPNLRLLVTSRELLRIQGETEYAVPPLAQQEAVSLFCERSQLEPSEEIAELCRRLDDMPLAVELAAARTKALSPAHILERLSQRLDLLKGGRDADPRQQTLRATIEWSYELLAEEEQQLFARLSVFAGGCTLEAAEEVCEADLDTLQSLVEKSLVRFTDGRYWMLETIREFAGELLHQTEDDRYRRFAEWVARLVEERLGDPGGAPPEGDLTDVYGESDNIRGALAWAWASEHVDLGIRIGSAALRLWGRSSPGEAAVWLDRVEGRIPRVAPQLQLRALKSAGVIAYHVRGDAESARRYWSRAIDIGRDRGDERSVLWLRGQIAALDRECGQLSAALVSLRDNLDAYEQLEDQYEQMRTLHDLGDTYAELGDLGAAQDAFLRAVTLSRAGGWNSALLHHLHSCGDLALRQEEFGRAIDCYREGLELSVIEGDDVSVVYCLAGLATVLVQTGRTDTGAFLWGAVTVSEDELGFKIIPGVRRRYEPQRAAVEGSEFWNDGRRLSLDEAVAYTLASLD